MKNLLKNKTVIGIIAIALAILICFVLTPIYNASVKEKIEIVRVSQKIEEGQEIHENMLEETSVGKYNLPEGVIYKIDDVKGKFAKSTLYKGDYVLEEKVSQTGVFKDDYLNNLDGEKNAISITVQSFAAGLSNKLKHGDIVSIVATDSDGKTMVPDELKYVKVLASTTGEGEDIVGETEVEKEESEEKIAATITLLVNEVQTRILANNEQTMKIHIALVYRGTEENCKKFLEAQDQSIYDQSDADIESKGIKNE